MRTRAGTGVRMSTMRAVPVIFHMNRLRTVNSNIDIDMRVDMHMDFN